MPNAGPTSPPQTLEAVADAINRNLTTIDRNVWEKAMPEYPEIAKIESTTITIVVSETMSGVVCGHRPKVLNPDGRLGLR